MTMVAAISGLGDSARARRRMAAAMLAIVALLLASCGGGSDGTSSAPAIDLTQDSTLDDAGDQGDPPADDPVETPVDDPDDSGDDDTPTPEPDPEPEERSIEDVQASTIRIAAQGTFQPVGESGELISAWSGTGFIIDEAGIAVTNNHVVTGAALLDVTIPGIEGTLNAVVLGRSECSDLAVIDIEGDGYQALEFRTEPVSPGLSVFAAGYPGSGIDGGQIENRDYTVTGGVVSNTTGTGDTQGSSVDVVIEHDAKIRGGNSGGPLVDEQARVVGINYFGGDLDDFNLAIAAQEALPLIEQLRSGNVETIGINAEAIVTENSSGVWVQGVESGSAADRAGVLPGDIILTMESLPMATDGTLATYCDVVRSHSGTDVIEIEVLRLATDELLTGQLNGDPLVQSFSFAQELADDMSDAPTGTGTGTEGGYTNFELVGDDSDQVRVEVPVEWFERDGSPAEFGPSIYAAPNLDGFLESWDVPGIIVEVNYDLGPADHDDVLNLWAPDCTSDGRDFFQTTDEAFAGRWEFWSNCGGTATSLITLAASPPDGSLVVRMWVQLVTQADIAAADRAIGTFTAVPN